MAQTQGSPAFQFYIDDYRGSRAVQRMTFAQRGMYIEMLIEQWDKGSLPDCPRACAQLLGGTDEEWIAAWPALRRKFVDRRAKPREEHEIEIPAEDDPDRRIVNLKLEKVRKAKRAYKRERQTSGRAGGEARARNLRTSPNLHAVANVGQLPQTSSSAIAKGSTPPPSVSPPPTPSVSPSPPPPVVRNGRALVDEEIAERAGRLVERYGELFYQHRGGAMYRPRPALDWDEGCDLCRLWPDDARLDKLATLVLTTDDPWISRTDRSFHIFALKASWADERLAAWEAKQVAAR
jgi:hypothetical protein